MTHSAVQVRKRLDLEIWWENCDLWLLSAVMSSISGNMTLDLLLSPRQTPQMWCYKIHYVSLLHFSHYLSVVVSSSHPGDPGLRPSIPPPSVPPPSSLHAQPEVPVVLPLWSFILGLLSIPLFTIRSWIHWQLPIKEKSNQSTHLHNGRYEPRPLTKIYTDTERKALGCIFYFSKAEQKMREG